MAHRKLIPALVSAAILGLVPAPVAAQQKSGFTIAVIDVQRILRESAASRSIRPQLERLKRGYEAEVKRQEGALRKANQDLGRQRAILSPEAYAERRREFQRQASQAQKDVQAKKLVIDRMLGRAMNKVHGTLRRVTVEIAREKSYNMVLPKSAVFLAEKRFDITAEALKRLDTRLPSVTITQPSKK